jgi:catalase
MRSADNNWDFWSNLPEALHQVTIVMTDRGIPKSFRHMHGFGSYTYSFINSENKRFWVKHRVVNDTGTTFLLGSEGLTVIRRTSVENDYRIHQMQCRISRLGPFTRPAAY